MTITSLLASDFFSARHLPGSQSSVFDLKAAASDLSEEDWRVFNRLTSVELSSGEIELAARPDRIAVGEKEYLAVHWHPEWAPLDLIRRRLDLAFPAAENFLAIPTQHNKIMSFGLWAGVEADVYDRSYNMKVQLLIHFSAERLPRAGALKAMMDRTYNYRAHQLLDILRALAEPGAVQVGGAVRNAVCDESVLMARYYAIRLTALIESSGILGGERDEMLKNRLLPDFIEARVCPAHRHLVDQALVFISAVKKKVKAALSPDEFYSPREVIEEARALKAGIVIPHPPQFWPILLDDLDVDGWEIWNPSTPEHSAFLLEALNRANQGRPRDRRLLVFMGDDTHMSAKFRPQLGESKNGAHREIGFQDPWFNQPLASALASAGQSRGGTINEYRGRMA